jgi:thiol-disulfide isomerase/thioredoxin
MTTRTWTFGATIALLLSMTIASPLLAQAASSFTASEDYMVEIDGKTTSTANLYWSQAARAFLIVAKELPTPLLVEPVSRQVRSVPLVKLASRADGSVGILEGAALTPKAVIDTTQGLASFNVDGRAIRVVDKPPLVGWQTPATLNTYSPKYGERADAYTLQAKAVGELRGRKDDVRLTVFFGSWCPFCQQKVPMVMKLARELAGSGVKIDFYGLPRNISSDPQAKKYGVKAVPTGIVFVSGKEVGRITADAWASPESSLAKILSQ